ncbi:MAG TPA: histidine kinase dimerization/phospho-acceptor domain-containing protein [Polyangiaceae bacterium]|jgi:signal transduction histidine kinase|nr:histidine kinase dimerization/phospho-acceptor domain-containing protein [Polyangiaceae bacterium]
MSTTASAAAPRLPQRVWQVQLLLGITVFVSLAGFAPQFLLLDDEVTRAALKFALKMVVPLGAIGFFLLRARMRRNRYVLRALAVGSAAIEPDDIARLSSVPGYATAVFAALLTGTTVLFLATPFRPALLDLDTAISLALFGVIVLATAALPLHVAVRAAVARSLELADPESMVGLLDRAEGSRAARQRLLFRLLLATVPPVGFVAIGSALIAHAHLRKFDAQARLRTAEIAAHVALESSSGSPSRTITEAGRAEASEAARALGFALRPEQRVTSFVIERGDDGMVSLTTPLDEGAAHIRFRTTAVRPIAGADVAIAFFAVAVAAAIGLSMGRSLSRDLSQATERVRLLRTEAVLRGEEPSPVPMRYTQVAALNNAIDILAGRFRIFARAQERAIEARAAARKLRSLLFASVSHDLRSPLNSILGFAGLVRQKPLSPAQRESLGFIEQSGRELLALIETILDMAKIEAGRMTLVKTHFSLGIVVAEAMRRSRLLAAARPLEFEVDIADGLPRIAGDESRLTQAISAIIWYSARYGEPIVSPDGTVHPIAIQVNERAGEAGVLIEIEAPSSQVPPDELQDLLASGPRSDGRRRYGGLTLGLGLARSIIGLHRGTLSVKRTPRGTALFEVKLPIR